MGGRNPQISSQNPIAVESEKIGNTLLDAQLPELQEKDRKLMHPFGLIRRSALAGCIFLLPIAATAGTAPIGPEDAMKFFTYICLGSMPNFSGGASLAINSGLVKSEGRFAHPKFSVEVDLADASGGRPRCSVNFHTRSGMEQVYDAVNALPGVTLNSASGAPLIYVQDENVTAMLGGDNIQKDYSLIFLGHE